ncbi:hypothetical protein PENSPDRAFT_682942 [Peniophora sp. CONT]|nr:hypothetical protein PENSPDRAFT_682942 [Peniophora sp. CONT]
MDTPPHAPELGLADLPPYADEQHGDDAHLGPYPLALVAIQAALTAIQYEEHQLLDDPRSERCLQDLDDALGAFMAYHYPPEPSISTPVVHQAVFTPQNQAAPLPGSPEPWNHPVPVNDGPGFEAEGAEGAPPVPMDNITPPQVGMAALPDDFDDAPSEASSAHEEDSQHEGEAPDDDQLAVQDPPVAAVPIDQPEEVAPAAVDEPAASQDASSNGVAGDVPGATSPIDPSVTLFTIPGVPRLAPYAALPSTLPVSSSIAGPSTSRGRPMPETRGGVAALAFLSERCKIPEHEQNLEDALIYAADLLKMHAYFAKENPPQTSNAHASGERRVGPAVQETRLGLEAPDDALVAQDKVLISGGKLGRGVRSLFASLRRRRDGVSVS